MSPPVEPISPWQYFWLVSISTVAGGIYLWPQYLVEHTGSNGIFSLIPSIFLATLLLLFQVGFARDLHQATFLSGLRRLLPVLGLGFIFPVTAVLCLLTDLILLALYGLMMHNFYYPFTPPIVIDGAIALTTGWVAMRTLSSVARTVQFWFPIILLGVVLVVTFNAANLIHPAAVIPSPLFLVRPWLENILSTWFLYANGSVVVTLTPHVRWDRKHSAYRMVIYAMAFQGFILVMFYFICLATLGAPAVSHLYWPIVYVFTLISTQAFFIKGLGIVVIITWTVAIVLFLAVHVFCFSFNITDQTAKPAGTLIRTAVVFAMVGLMAGSTLLIPSDLVARTVLFHWLNPLDFGWAALVSPGLWLLSNLLRRRSAAQ